MAFCKARPKKDLRDLRASREPRGKFVRSLEADIGQIHDVCFPNKGRMEEIKKSDHTLEYG
ncbi:hypothetical protein ACO22_01399 [Paracoccidioides brasiliensis]|uniref:Uncharacterized protein n=1 Tax=Paracoccidioides brasiliensis TaxID=121759 RepID=A0A1D2JLR7_PARBR|nr:hypothetical protein ACO22_01399 [Paracoccidioides brasiliensis]